MNVLLLAVTGVWLLLAGFMSAVGGRMAREEQGRSDARVAILAAALYEDDVEPSAAVSQLLEQMPPVSWRRQVVAVIVGGCVVAAIGGVAIFSAAAPRTTATHGSAGPQQGDLESAPPGLLALEHERGGERLVVRGSVGRLAGG